MGEYMISEPNKPAYPGWLCSSHKQVLIKKGALLRQLDFDPEKGRRRR